MEKMTLEENTIFSDQVLSPIMEIIDNSINVFQFDIDKLKATLDEMKSQVSTLHALPFPETMNQAETKGAIVKLYANIIKLIELRMEQIKVAENQSNMSPGDEMLKSMGLL